MDEVEKLKEQLAAKQGAINEFLRTIQEKDSEIRRLFQERKVLDNQVEDLTRKLRYAAGRLEDLKRDHRTLLDGMQLYTHAYGDLADAVDEIDAALEIGDPKSTIRKVIDEARTKTVQARSYASADYTRRAQERMLLQIWKNCRLPQEIQEELSRLMENTEEYLMDPDNKLEVQEQKLKAAP